jgi:predicted MFS family arabinose efflux permease
VADPAIVFERGLVSLEKSVSLVHRGAALLTRESPGHYALDELKEENTFALCIGLVFFSLATSMFFTPLPVFFAANLTLQTSTIFMLYMINSVSCLIGYFLVKNTADELNVDTSARKITLLRGLLVLLPILVPFTPFPVAIILSATVLAAMGFVYAFYSVSVVSASMEVIPQGKAGLFTALVGAGSAIGCLFGPLIAESVGFHVTFVASAASFLLSYGAFKRFAHGNLS